MGTEQAGKQACGSPLAGKWALPALPSYLPIHAIATDFHEAVYKKKERRKPTGTAEKKSKTVSFLAKKQL